MVSFQHWLIRYREASLELWYIVAPITECIEKSCPPWSSYWSLKEVCLIVMDKYSGVRPVGIGDTWQRLFAKYIFAVVGAEAKESYGAENIFRGMEAEIKGRIHTMRLMWQQYSQE